MDWLVKGFLDSEFAIAEAPLEIPRAPEAAPTGAPPQNGHSAGGMRRDLVSILGDLVTQRADLAGQIEALRKAVPREDEFGQFAKQAVLFLDALDRIVEMGKNHSHSEEIDAWLKSVEAANQRVLRLFEKYGLAQTDCVGEEVDLDRHEVVEYRKTSEYPHNVVIQERLRGYTFRGKLLRDAKVVVACNDEG